MAGRRRDAVRNAVDEEPRLMGMDMYMRDLPEDVPAEYGKEHPNPGRFRFPMQWMAAMVALMDDAGLLSHELSPDPPRAPEDDRLVDCALSSDPSVREGLPMMELAVVNDYRAKMLARQATRSPNPQKVPAYKFESNEAWIVSAEECRLLAKGLRRAAAKVSAAAIKRAQEAYGQADGSLEVLVHGQLGMQAKKLSAARVALTAAEARSWLLEWATYNEIAASAGGYQVM
jgi:hypothetical protein